MATFTFDGTSSITASKADTVIITADPTTFTQASDNGANTTFAFGANTLTITGSVLSSTANNYPNVFLSNGTFDVGGGTATTLGATPTNLLSVLNDAATSVSGVGTAATSKIAIFGGLGRVDANDLGDSISIGGKGSILVYGNAGVDTIGQATASASAFDSTSVVNVYGDQGADGITLTNVLNKASIFVSAGADTDAVTVRNAGATTIFGGLDSNDGADTIALYGDSVSGAAGTSIIYGNGGADVITVGGDSTAAAPGVVALDSTSTTTIYGGFGDDVIQANGVKATISIIGGEGKDNIAVANTGNTFITGGNQSGGDQSLDGVDTIAFAGSGNVAIYGNAGNDGITFNLNDSANTSTVNIYGGKGADVITETLGSTAGKASIFIAGGEDGDQITAAGNGGAVTIFGGIGNADSSDAADTISYSGTGTANIFGNGGADNISIGLLGNDSTNTVTVSGGAGNDTITVGVQAPIAGGQVNEQLVVSGNEGSDTFAIIHNSAAGTSVGQTITISDFTLGTTGDKLTISSGTNATTTALQVTTSTGNTLQDALNAAANAAGAANHAGAVVYQGSTYVVVSDGTAGYSATGDQAIKLTGVTDLLTLQGQTTITSTT